LRFEIVSTCTQRGKQFKVCCGLTLRLTLSSGFTCRLAFISSRPDILLAARANNFGMLALADHLNAQKRY